MNNTLRQVANPKARLREVPSPSWNRLPLSRWAPIPLRLIVGYGFMAHGFAKLTKGPDAFATILHALPALAVETLPFESHLCVSQYS
jgi:hypothetical protein